MRTSVDVNRLGGVMGHYGLSLQSSTLLQRSLRNISRYERRLPRVTSCESANDRTSQRGVQPGGESSRLAKLDAGTPDGFTYQRVFLRLAANTDIYTGPIWQTPRCSRFPDTTLVIMNRGK